MKTDLPLKRLTRLCAGDLLPWLGAPAATVLLVESLELPASQRRLDNLLHLRDPNGQEYLHLIEWQGYDDPLVLWRGLEYLSWLGLNRPERPICCTLIYLNPGADAGDTLEQARTMVGGWRVQFHVVRLWELSATGAVASRRPGLLALSPLLAGATTELVEQAALRLLTEAAPPVQGELLAALGVFAAPLITTERFIRLVTKERLMATDLIAYLLKDKEAELAERLKDKEAAFAERVATLEERLKDKEVAFAAEKEALHAMLLQEKATLEDRLVEAAQREAEAAERAAAQAQAQLRTTLQQAIEDAIIARFPAAPATLTRRLRGVNDPARLQTLLTAVITAPDLAAVEALFG